MYVYDLSNVAWKEFKNFNFLGIFRQTFIIVIRAVYPHSFFADPAPAVFFQSGSGPSCFLNADQYPTLKTYICKKNL